MSVVARSLKYNVAIMFVVSMARGSDSHCVTWFRSYLCNVFVHFLHNRSVLLTNPEVLCEEIDLYFVQKKILKRRC